MDADNIKKLIVENALVLPTKYYDESTKSDKRRSFLICVDGNKGSGKNTLIGKLHCKISGDFCDLHVNCLKESTYDPVATGRRDFQRGLNSYNPQLKEKLIMRYVTMGRKDVFDIDALVQKYFYDLDVVLFNRYWPTTLVHQIAVGADLNPIINEMKGSYVLPDLTIILLSDVQTQLQRIYKRLENTGREVEPNAVNTEVLRKMNEAYQNLKTILPDECSPLFFDTTNKSMDEIAEEIYPVFRELYNKTF